MAATLTGRPSRAIGRQRADPGASRRPPGRRAPLLVAIALAVSGCGGLAVVPGAPADGSATIGMGAPLTLDPAVAGDQSSAAVIAQLFETVTDVDADLVVRPALAGGWTVTDDGRQITFHLRPDLTFSDGTPLAGEDVVRSWLRLLDPARPAPLAGLLDGVEGAADYRSGQGSVADVALSAENSDVVVGLTRPAADFPAIVASPAFAVVPEGVGTNSAALSPGTLVASGGYRLAEATATGLRLEANERYWAGPPAIATIEIVHDVGGRSAVDVFSAGELDYVGVGSSDASWIAFDAELGPALREEPSLSLEFYGFDTTRPPFDDPLVRRAFASAVDWPRLVQLADGGRTTPATSMVPPGIPGRSDEPFGAVHDPDEARRLLAEAGYPDGAGFPAVIFLTTSGYAGAAAIEWGRELGVQVAVESMGFDAYYQRLSTDPPAIFSVGWIADYPGPDDFLGLLLGTGQANNFGRWSSVEFDAAVARANAEDDETARRAAFDEAERIVQTQAPVIPIAYGRSWALSNPDLLGAVDNGMGKLRMAGLAWRGDR